MQSGRAPGSLRSTIDRADVLNQSVNIVQISLDCEIDAKLGIVTFEGRKRLKPVGAQRCP